MTILTAGKIIGVAPWRAVVGGQRVNASFEMITHFGVCENDLTCGLLYVTATQAVHRLGADRAKILIGQKSFLMRIVTTIARDTALLVQGN